MTVFSFTKQKVYGALFSTHEFTTALRLLCFELNQILVGLVPTPFLSSYEEDDGKAFFFWSPTEIDVYEISSSPSIPDGGKPFFIFHQGRRNKKRFLHCPWGQWEVFFLSPPEYRRNTKRLFHCLRTSGLLFFVPAAAVTTHD